MLRYGVAKTTELRLLVDAGEVSGNWGVFPLTLSVKQRLLSARKWIPAISFVGYVNYGRIATNDFQDDGINYQATLAFENNLSDRVTLGYNIGTNNNFRMLILTTGVSYTINDKLSAYIEYFSTIGHASSAHYADGGLLYLINPHFQLDIACGHSIFSKDPRFYVTTGVSYMFERKENK